MDSIGPCISIFFSESNSAVTLPVSTVSLKSYRYSVGYKTYLEVRENNCTIFMHIEQTIWGVSYSDPVIK